MKIRKSIKDDPLIKDWAKEGAEELFQAFEKPTINNMDKLKLLQDWENTYKEISKTFDLFSKLTGADPESPLFAALFNTHEQYTDVLALAIGANVEDLCWYIYENDCGAKQMEAKNPNWKKARKIKNTKDLLMMIEDI